MSSVNQQKLMDIASLTSKMLRKNFGRGPDSCQVFINKCFLVFYIRGFLSPLETVLLENGSSDNIEISRSIVMNNVLSQLKGILELEFERDVLHAYHDWIYPNNTGMITIVFDREVLSQDEDGEEFAERQPLIDEISRISELVQKNPDKIEVFRISPRVYLVQRSGILVTIEKALIKKGYENTLKVTKDELEKTYFHNDGRFEGIFKQPVADIFVDWNFEDDNSMMCFVLKESK